MSNPEIGSNVDAGGIRTNYHDAGAGDVVVLLHGSGPGVSAWANWRLNLPVLAEHFRVVAPDIVGFGFTDRPSTIAYGLETWVDHLVSFLDALDIERASVVGNSFGGALSLSLAATHPDRVDRLVLMGSAGISFPLTEGLDTIWGYEPSPERMRGVLDIMAFDRSLVSDELAVLRFEAATRPGVQEAYASMFPAPRQRWIEALATSDDRFRNISHEVLIIHGREDRVLPVQVAYELLDRLDRAQLHVFGLCGHWTQIEQANRFNLLVTNFLQEHR